MSGSETARWRKRSLDVLASEVVAKRSVGPAPPKDWEPALRQLVEVSRKPAVGPSWWTPSNAFFGNVETRLDPASYAWDGMTRLGKGARPLFFFQFTLAGWGLFEHGGGPPQRIEPGMAFFAVVPSRHRYYLPESSPGWTFGWLGIYHPYLLERVTKQVKATGPVVTMEPGSAFVASALRLVRGAFRRDFRDPFEVELALFDFVLSYERQAYQASDPDGERDRLLDAVRKRVLLDPAKALAVDEIAAEYGMTRSHFSHFFRARTGLTPARYVTETRVREAARMLLSGRAPLKQIADACGFANVNHFGKVFRRFQHMSPAAYRRALG